MSDIVPTRQRLIHAAMRLFASRGFDATSVGEIEAAAGLEPRRGGLYKHFPSKQAVLDVAVRAKLEDARTVAETVSTLGTSAWRDADAETLRHLLTELGLWFLREMDEVEDLTRIFEHDAHRLVHLVDEVRTELVDLSYRSAAGLIRSIRPGIEDPEAMAVITLASLVAVRRTEWTYGATPLGIDDDRFLVQWANQTLVALLAAPERTPDG